MAGGATRCSASDSFLLAVVAIAMGYGIINDIITCRISWEYFLFGKGLSEKLGSTLPPDMRALSWEAGKIGLKASWTAGLIIGVALLMANNPSRRSERLPYRRLLSEVPIIFLACVACAIALGLAGYVGGLTRFSTDFQEMTRNHEFRPERFIAVFGIHLGAYAGGVIGTIVAVIRIRLARRAKGLNSA